MENPLVGSLNQSFKWRKNIHSNIEKSSRVKDESLSPLHLISVVAADLFPSLW